LVLFGLAAFALVDLGLAALAITFAIGTIVNLCLENFTIMLRRTPARD
jgi:hypothetical protein